MLIVKNENVWVSKMMKALIVLSLRGDHCYHSSVYIKY